MSGIALLDLDNLIYKYLKGTDPAHILPDTAKQLLVGLQERHRKGIVGSPSNDDATSPAALADDTLIRGGAEQDIIDAELSDVQSHF